MAAETIVLHANCKKTEYMLFNQDEIDLKPMSGDLLKQVHDFKYLGSWMAHSKKDMKVPIGLAWKALNKLDKIWKSKLKSRLKIQFFRSTVKVLCCMRQKAGPLQTKSAGYMVPTPEC